MNSLFLINQALKSRASSVRLKYDKQLLLLLKQLYGAGYISGYQIMKNCKSIIVSFNFINNRSTFTGIKRISTPGHRTFFTFKQLQRRYILEKKIYILNTARGPVISNLAIAYKLGGEALYELTK